MTVEDDEDDWDDEDEMEDDAFHEEDYDDPYVTFGQVEADFD